MRLARHWSHGPASWPDEGLDRAVGDDNQPAAVKQPDPASNEDIVLLAVEHIDLASRGAPYPERAYVAKGVAGARNIRLTKALARASCHQLARAKRDRLLQLLLVLCNEKCGGSDHDRSHRGIRHRQALNVQLIQRTKDVLKQSLDLRASRKP